MCFVPPFVLHTLEVFDDSVVINLQIRRDTFDDLFFNSLRANNILSVFFMSCLYSQNPAKRIVFSTNGDEEIRDLVLNMYEEIVFRDEYSARLLASMVPVLFVKTLRGYGKTASLKTATPQMRSSRIALRLITYINDNYKDITLEALAEHFNYSVPHCSKLIRDETGTGFVFFVRRVRMSRAASLLQTTSSSIADIGEMVGYDTTESFIRAFQKVYNKDFVAQKEKQNDPIHRQNQKTSAVHKVQQQVLWPFAGIGSDPDHKQDNDHASNDPHPPGPCHNVQENRRDVSACSGYNRKNSRPKEIRLDPGIMYRVHDEESKRQDHGKPAGNEYTFLTQGQYQRSLDRFFPLILDDIVEDQRQHRRRHRQSYCDQFRIHVDFPPGTNMT